MGLNTLYLYIESLTCPAVACLLRSNTYPIFKSMLSMAVVTNCHDHSHRQAYLFPAVQGCVSPDYACQEQTSSVMTNTVCP